MVNRKNGLLKRQHKATFNSQTSDFRRLILVTLMSVLALPRQSYGYEEWAFWNTSHLNCLPMRQDGPTVTGGTLQEAMDNTVAVCAANTDIHTSGICTIAPQGQITDANWNQWPYYINVEGMQGGRCDTPYHDKIYVRYLANVDRASKPQRCQVTYPVGNPMEVTTGTKIETVDLGLKINGEAVRLIYKSRPNGSPRPAGKIGGWELSTQRKLDIDKSSTGVVVHVKAARGGADYVSFLRTGNVFAADPDVSDTLTQLSNGWEYRDYSRGVIEQYDSFGVLFQTIGSQGGSVVYEYDGSGASQVLKSILVDGRRRYVLAYDADKLISIGLQGGAQIASFGYVGNQLQKITWPDGAILQYLYEDTSGPGRLTGVIDESSARLSKFVYDSAGFLLSTERGNGLWRFSRSADSNPYFSMYETYDELRSIRTFTTRLHNGGTVSLTLPNGQVTSVQTTEVQSNILLSSASQPAGSGCAVSSRHQDYDSNGNINWKEDFKGNRTCYGNLASRNLEVSRVEGLPAGSSCSTVAAEGSTLPASARRISTQWHPDWRLASKIAEPRRLTTKVYNGQPDPFNGGAIAACAPGTATFPDGKPIAVLCKQVEQATTDANGAWGFSATVDTTAPMRVLQWTYDQYGQVLIAKDSLNNATTYTYYSDTTADHTLGDLATVSNPLNQVTRYAKYSPAGQWLEMVDVNGKTTVRTFDARQRLKSVTLGALTTNYDYWPTGLLKSVTQTDGSSISYGYDDAHRLTSVTDNLGNSITYTLDNSGNRIAENVTDPAGRLARTLARTPDALNRIQQVNGRE